MTKVCIEQTAEGFAVYDPDANQQNNEGDVIGAETPAQTVASLDEALNAARTLLGGEAEQPAEQNASQSLQAGFQRGRGIPL